ncbi:unnamed protein product [Blumeria hordei]|uniref:Uncharacterized protein n=2 Tax=Blumeria hordei TaxID=2867405 RepID=A0A383UT27_BLUHO|nr:pre-mRNA cleavage and polyadenylation protein [Blumeria hordei DH14]SZF02906.1 unnamed protein product [Blumeria hordei]
MSMITATVWVPRGVAASFPKKSEFDEEEFRRIAKLAKLQLQEANDDLDDAQKCDAIRLDSKDNKSFTVEEATSKNIQSIDEHDDDLREYDLEHYDDDVLDEKDDEGSSMGIFSNFKSLVYHQSNKDDPYITMHENEEDDEEREDLQILATDNLLLTAKVEDEISHLEIYVYEDEADNLYVHHDIMLPAIPLCVERLDFAVGKQTVDQTAVSNFVAVGTFDPDIEIWDLDTIDCMYPNAILGQGGDMPNSDSESHPKKKKKKSKKSNDKYHVDSVLALASNRQHRNLLASASADKTVKLWDLNTAKCAKSYSQHSDKVCSLQWHPSESTILLSGSYDRTVVAADMRAPESKAPTWGVESDVEMVKWDPHNSNFFFIATEGGMVHYHDIRNAPISPANSKPTWVLQAHDSSVSAFDVNPIIPGFISTGSTDRQVKLWNILPSGPSMVVSRDLDVGKVFSANFAPDKEVGFRLAVAGSKGTVQIWDTSTNPAVRKAFVDRIGTDIDERKERLVGVQSDGSDESDDEVDQNSTQHEKDTEQGWESMDEN